MTNYLKCLHRLLLQPGRFPYLSRTWPLLAGFLLLSACSMLKQGKKTEERHREDISSHLADTGSVSNLFMDAVQDMMLDRTDSAFIRFNQVLKLQPDNATAHYQLSRLWLKKDNNLTKAIEEIKQAYALDSNNQWISERYAGLLALDGRYREAAALYGLLAKNANAPEEYLIRQAMALQQAGKYRAALDVLNELKIYAGADDETALIHRQKLFLLLKETDSAIAESKLLVRYYPKQPEYLLLLGNIYFDAGRAQEGLATFRQADRLFPGNVLVQQSLARYYWSQRDTLSLYPYLGEVLLEREENLSEKLDILSMFADYRKKDTLAKTIAYRFALKLADKKPPESDALSFYGFLLDEDGDKDSAVTLYRQAIKADSAKYLPWHQLFVIYGSQARADSLLLYTERAARFFPDNPLIYYFRSFGYILNKDYRNAVPVLQEGVSTTDPADTEMMTRFYSSLGDAYQELDNPGAADSNYRAALRLQPENVSVLNNYSYFLSQQGMRLKEAEHMSARTLKANPDEAVFLDTYGWILFKQGRYREAKRYLEKALENMPEKESAVTTEHLGDVEYKLGNLESALKYWQKARMLGASPSLDYKIKNKKLDD